MVKYQPAFQETGVQSLSWEDSLENEIWQPPSVFLPGEFHGQKNLVVYSSWSHKKPDVTERLTLSLPAK